MRQFLRSAAFKAVLCLPLLWATSAFGQGTFQASSTSTAVNKTGHTELVGSITLTVASGTTVAGTVEITYGRVLSDATGITLTKTGGLAAATVTAVIPESGIVIISIPAGAALGSSLTLSGARISVAGSTTTTLNATLSSSGNSIVAGQNSVRVVNQMLDTMVVDPATSTSITFTNGVLVSAPAAFLLREGFERSFSSAVGVLGQTVATQVIFKVIGLPDNVVLTFPAGATAPSGATLTTTSGTDEMLTNQSPTNRVTYRFTGSGSSDLQIDSFSITPTVSITGQVKTGTIFIQAAVGPIGAAQPNANFPSTAIPRFDELFLPEISVPVPTPTRYFFPVPTPVTSESIVITNTSTGGAAVTIRARREDGTVLSGNSLTAESTVNLLAKQTATYSLTQLFGSAADTNQIGSIEVESQNDQILPSTLTALPGGKASTAAIRELQQAYLPFDRRTSADVPLIAISTSGTATGNVNFTLRSVLGQSVATATRSLAGNGALRSSLTDLFSLQSGALPLAGYLQVDSTIPVRSAIYNHPTELSDSVAGLLPIARTPMIFPFFVFGSGYNTVIELINTAPNTNASVTTQLYRADGTLLSTGSPLVREIPALNRMDLDLAALFGSGASGVSTGYVVLTVRPVASNPFAGLPALIGAVRVFTGTSSVMAPLVADPSTEFFITPTAETAALYTGVAITNDGSTAINVTVDAFSGAGAQLGTTTFTLSGGSFRSQLLRELIPGSLGHDGGYVRISSPSPMNVVTFRGNLTSTELIHLPLQKLP